MNFAVCTVIALGALSPAACAIPDLAGLAEKLEAEDFKAREEAVVAMAAAADDQLEEVIRYQVSGDERHASG